MTNPFRAFSVLGLGAVVAGGIAWSSGELQRFGLSAPSGQPMALAGNPPSVAAAELSDLTKAADEPANAAIDQAVLPPTRNPTFDIVRVQPDGSMVIAGRAAPGAAIDIVSSGRVIGQTSTDESGSFAFVLEQPLAPGDYNIGLTATINGENLQSEETAVVQIPTKPDGDVLAIVTAPGVASEVIAAGAVSAFQNNAQVAAEPNVSTEVAALSEPAADAVATADPALPVVPVVPDAQLRIEAVEIDGTKTFIAGTAPAGTSVRLYLGETLLGDTKANQGGRFLVETTKPIAVGNQILRADAVDGAGKVIARASVPFERVDSEKLAVVAAGTGGNSTASEPEVAAAESVVPEVTPIVQAENPTTPGQTVAVAAATKLSRVETSVIIRKGDTLWQIARRVYGKGVTFSTIYNANVSQIRNPNRIWPGQVFAVPKATEDGEAADFTGIDGQQKLDVVVE